MSANTIPTTSEVLDWGGLEAEQDINFNDQAAMVASEARLAELQAANRDEIDWQLRPEAEDQITGRVYDGEKQQLGLVVLDRSLSGVRIMSEEALQNELGAKTALLYAGTFAGRVAVSSLEWRLPDSIEDGETGLGTAAIGDVRLVGSVRRIGRQTESISSAQDWQLFTKAEYRAFLAGGVDGDFDYLVNDSLPTDGGVPGLSPSISMLDFGGSLMERDGRLSYAIFTDLAERWATRSRSSLAFKSNHSQLVLDSFAKAQEQGSV